MRVVSRVCFDSPLMVSLSHRERYAHDACVEPRASDWSFDKLRTSGQLCPVIVVVLAFAIAIGASAQPAEKSCDAFLLAPRQVKGKSVGPKSCLMQETSATYEGRALTRIDVGLD